MNKDKVIICMMSFIILFLCIIILYDDEDNTVFSDSILKKDFSNAISMMYETEASSGVYEESNNASWPQSGYKFNENLSKCENGSTLSWDESANKNKMVGNTSDKCYVYFDKSVTFADYIKTKVFTGVQGENNIYLHKNLSKSAEDSSYRYAGSYEAVNNYVCFGYDSEDECPWDDMYRIIGVFGDNVKLIKADYAKENELGTGVAYYDNYAVWEATTTSVGTNKGKNSKNVIGAYKWTTRESYYNHWDDKLYSGLNMENLNGTYLNNFNSTWQEKIAIHDWVIGGNTKEKIISTNVQIAYQNEILNPSSPTIYSAKIGLMYVSDYGFAADPSAWIVVLNSYGRTDITNKNWMYMGLWEWTITRNSSSDDYVNAIYVSGYAHDNGTPNSSFAIRPCFYLIPEITLIGGTGDSSDPYIIR